jgi:hypothetical protein
MIVREIVFDLATVRALLQKGFDKTASVRFRARSKITVSPGFIAALLADNDSRISDIVRPLDGSATPVTLKANGEGE